MTRMMETLEFRQMFSITAVEPTLEPAALPADTSATAVTVSDIVVTKPVDKSSPKLFLFCASGQHYPTVKL